MLGFQKAPGKITIFSWKRKWRNIICEAMAVLAHILARPPGGRQSTRPGAGRGGRVQREQHRRELGGNWKQSVFHNLLLALIHIMEENPEIGKHHIITMIYQAPATVQWLTPDHTARAGSKAWVILLRKCIRKRWVCPSGDTEGGWVVFLSPCSTWPQATHEPPGPDCSSAVWKVAQQGRPWRSWAPYFVQYFWKTFWQYTSRNKQMFVPFQPTPVSGFQKIIPA